MIRALKFLLQEIIVSDTICPAPLPSKKKKNLLESGSAILSSVTLNEFYY